MKSLNQYELSDLKRIYRTLHGQLQQDFDLMESDLMHDLQTYLHLMAGEKGVDISVHEQWATWLNDGEPASCSK